MWETFLELSAARPAGAPLSFAEIDAYSRLTGSNLQPWEVQLIRRIDQLALEAVETRTQIDPRTRSIDKSDGKGMASMLRGMAARKQKKAAP